MKQNDDTVRDYNLESSQPNETNCQRDQPIVNN